MLVFRWGMRALAQCFVQPWIAGVDGEVGKGGLHGRGCILSECVSVYAGWEIFPALVSRWNARAQCSCCF